MKIEKKYKLTDETFPLIGHTLYRIEALKDFSDVKKGDKGGFVESEDNLSQDGDCWVYGTAKVYGNAKVHGNALLLCPAWATTGWWLSQQAFSAFCGAAAQ